MSVEKLARATLEYTFAGTARKLSFQVNPALLSRTRTVAIEAGPSERASEHGPGQTFASRACAWAVSFTMHLEGDDLEATLGMLEELVEPAGHPPRVVTFRWGVRTWEGHVTSLSLNETWFASDLRPARVEADISMTILTVSEDVAARTGKVVGP